MIEGLWIREEYEMEPNPWFLSLVISAVFIQTMILVEWVAVRAGGKSIFTGYGSPGAARVRFTFQFIISLMLVGALFL